MVESISLKRRENLQFRLLCTSVVPSASISLAAAEEDEDDGAGSFLATSDATGMLYMAVKEGVVVARVRDIEERALSGKKVGEEVDFPLLASAQLGSRPSTLAVSADGARLAIASRSELSSSESGDESIYFYSASSLISGGSVAPAATAPLDGKAVSLKWRPGSDSPPCVLVVTSAGTACVVGWDGRVAQGIPDRGCTFSSGAWHSSGRLLALGTDNLELVIFRSSDPAQAPVAQGFAPEDVTCVVEGPGRLDSIVWLSDSLIYALYCTSLDDGDEVPVESSGALWEFDESAGKLLPIAYDSGLCFPSVDAPSHFSHKFHCAKVVGEGWNVAVAACGLSIDVAVLAAAESSEWIQVDQDEEFKASLPQNDDDEDTFPRGLAVSLNSHLRLPFGDDGCPPSPLTFLLTNEGRLLTYALVDTNKGNNSDLLKVPVSVPSVQPTSAVALATATATALAPSSHLGSFGAGSSAPSFSFGAASSSPFGSFGAATTAKPLFGAAPEAGKFLGTSFSFGKQASTPASAAKVEGGASAGYPPMSSKAPTAFGGAAGATPAAPLVGGYPPMSSKAPTPFGGASAATGNKAATTAPSAGGYPPMSSKAPTPFGGASAATGNHEAAPSASSSGGYPPMSSKAPTPFGTAPAPSAVKSSLGGYPPISSKAPTPFGTAKPASPVVATAAAVAAAAAASSGYPPMSSKAPTPFGAAPSTPSKSSLAAATSASASSGGYPPISSKAPTPFGAASIPSAISSKATTSAGTSSSGYPPMSSKAPSPFGAAPRESASGSLVAAPSAMPSSSMANASLVTSPAFPSSKESPPVASKADESSRAGMTAPIAASLAVEGKSKDGSVQVIKGDAAAQPRRVLPDLPGLPAKITALQASVPMQKAGKAAPGTAYEGQMWDIILSFDNALKGIHSKKAGLSSSSTQWSEEFDTAVRSVVVATQALKDEFAEAEVALELVEETVAAAEGSCGEMKWQVTESEALLASRASSSFLRMLQTQKLDTSSAEMKGKIAAAAEQLSACISDLQRSLAMRSDLKAKGVLPGATGEGRAKSNWAPGHSAGSHSPSTPSSGFAARRLGFGYGAPVRRSSVVGSSPIVVAMRRGGASTSMSGGSPLRGSGGSPARSPYLSDPAAMALLQVVNTTYQRTREVDERWQELRSAFDSMSQEAYAAESRIPRDMKEACGKGSSRVRLTHTQRSILCRALREETSLHEATTVTQVPAPSFSTYMPPGKHEGALSVAELQTSAPSMLVRTRSASGALGAAVSSFVPHVSGSRLSPGTSLVSRERGALSSATGGETVSRMGGTKVFQGQGASGAITSSSTVAVAANLGGVSYPPVTSKTPSPSVSSGPTAAKRAAGTEKHPVSGTPAVAATARAAAPSSASASPPVSSSSGYPPMSSKAPTPFGAKSSASAAPSTSSGYPPMSSKAPTPFGATKTAAAPVSSKAPTPFSTSTTAQPEPSKRASPSRSSDYPPVSTKAPTPFGFSAADSTASETLSGAGTSKPSSSGYPPMSSKAPTPFGVVDAKKADKAPADQVASSAASPALGGAIFKQASVSEVSSSPFSFGGLSSATAAVAATALSPTEGGREPKKKPSSTSVTPLFGAAGSDKSATGAHAKTTLFGSLPSPSVSAPAPAASTAASSSPSPSPFNIGGASSSGTGMFGSAAPAAGPFASTSSAGAKQESPLTSSAATADVRSQVVEIYRIHNPQKLGDVDGLLAKYQGREAELVAKLKKKYNNGTGAPSLGSTVQQTPQKPSTAPAAVTPSPFSTPTKPVGGLGGATTDSSPFGAAAPQFGSVSTPSGGGLFGSGGGLGSSAPAPSPFGPKPAFGQSTASATGFGAAAASPAQASPFGAPASGSMGQGAFSSSAFGAPQTPASSTGFGIGTPQPATPGSGGLFGGGTPQSNAAQSSFTPQQLAVVRQWMLEVYQKHNPQQYSRVDEFLAKYRGSETKMVQKLCQKYGVSPPSGFPAAPGASPQQPQGFGGGVASAFGVASNPSPGGAFGMSSSTAPVFGAVGFGAPQAAPAPSFGAPSQLGGGSVFGQPLQGQVTGGFGQVSASHSGFGAQVQQGGGFGQQQQQQPSVGGFGQVNASSAGFGGFSGGGAGGGFGSSAPATGFGTLAGQGGGSGFGAQQPQQQASFGFGSNAAQGSGMFTGNSFTHMRG